MKGFLVLAILIVSSVLVFGQTATLKGEVRDAFSNETLPYVTISILETDKGTTTNDEGTYEISGIEPGYYNIEFSYIGYKTVIKKEVQLTTSRTNILNVELEEDAFQIDEIELEVVYEAKSEESPVSARSISNTEIIRNPGGNRDISKVIQSLPGVSSTVSFRNDIIIRGGAPNENRFYLDGIEVPNINHFATQGSSGGPVGMINVNFINEVNFYSGAFPANRGNALSSVFDFKQKEGNTEEWITSFTVGSSDLGLTFDGPIGDNSSLIFSVRRSYLQYLFTALKLPFLPTYNDAQFKYVYNINDKNKLTFIGLGAIDDFELNSGVNENVEDSLQLLTNEYILGYIPVNTQWNYTVGGKWQHFGEKNVSTFVLSRSHLNNQAIKYLDNDDSSEDNKLLDYSSQEVENKLRFENKIYGDKYKINYGVGLEYIEYFNSTYNKVFIQNQTTIIDFESKLNLFKHNYFGQISRAFFNGRWSLSLGARMDGISFSSDMNNPFKQFSPRFSSAFYFNEDFSFNANVGRYYQLPSLTVLGYRDSEGKLVNKNNDLQWIKADHAVAGFEYKFSEYFSTSIEGFYKLYDNYPFLLNDSISLANLGGDFGVIGNEPVVSRGEGRSYGMEVLIQQKAKKGVYGILAYTWVKSEYKDKNDLYVPSSWDSRHIISLTAGKTFKKNWELGMKFRFTSGNPYTPYDAEQSALIPVWNANQTAVFDYTQLNSLRTPMVHGLDVRLDKKWYLKKVMLNVYLDIQNVYNYQTELQPYLITVKDVNGNNIIDPSNPMSYQMQELPNVVGTLLPSVGLMFEF